MSRAIRVDAEVRERLDAIQADLQASAPGRVRGAGTSMSAAAAAALRRSGGERWRCVVCGMPAIGTFRIRFEAGDRPPFPGAVVGLCEPHEEALLAASERPAVAFVPPALEFCAQGHPGHDPARGCGPCADEIAAGLR